MTKTKKRFSLLLTVILAVVTLTAVLASPTMQIAVYSKSNIDFTGSGRVIGDTVIESGILSGNNRQWVYDGSIYKFPDVEIRDNFDVNRNFIVDYDGEEQDYQVASLKEAPGAEYFVDIDTVYQDGTKNFTVGWRNGEYPDGTTIDKDCYIKTLLVSNSLTLNIQVPQGEVRFIRVKTLEVHGKLAVTGGGHVVLYIDEDIKSSTGGTINATASNFGDQDALTFVFNDDIGNIKIDNFSKISANIYAGYTNFHFNNTSFKGNVYTAGQFKMTNSGVIYGLVYAPNSDTYMENSAAIEGKLITGELKISGNAYVKYGSVNGLPEDIADIILEGQDPDPDPTTGPTDEPTGDPGTDPTEDPGIDDGDPQKMVTIKATIARRMAIRLEDGTVLYNGDTFTMHQGGTIKFQVCTVNWASGTYADGGTGIAGPKVYEYTDYINKENCLRVDNDRFFNPVKFHFTGVDYQKLTGVQYVLENPLESLSINFPLGATVRVYAYVKNQIVDTQDVFITSDLDWYTWPY